MTLHPCPFCGLMISYADHCQHHTFGADNWAAGNRALCNFLHRGEELPRLNPADRDEA